MNGVWVNGTPFGQNASITAVNGFPLTVTTTNGPITLSTGPHDRACIVDLDAGNVLRFLGRIPKSLSPEDVEDWLERPSSEPWNGR